MSKKRFILSILILFVGVAQLYSQVRVSGTVTSAANGEPLPFVTVSVKGTTIGGETDDNGNYSINVPNDAKVLMFSFVGYTTIEENINGRKVVNVSLASETTLLDEVVVTALGISKEKRALSYSVQSIKSDDLVQGASPDLSGALQGKVSGMSIKHTSGMPGASSLITIRGARSFTGNNSPLYVIDGMPVASTSDVTTGNSVTGTDFSNRAIDIDPNDIESINVLKGQAASSLYGIRASNGVIVITTKSGRGVSKGKVHVSFSSNVTFDKVSRYPKLQKTYAQGSQMRYAPTTSLSWGPKIVDLPNDSKYGGNSQGHPGMYKVPQRENAGLDPWVAPAVYDNIKDFFRTGFIWNNSLNIAQSSNLGFYSISLGNSYQDGIISSTGMKRYNAKVAGETKLSENWTSGFTATFINTSIKKLPSANDGIIATVYPAPLSYDLKGIPSHYAGNPYKQNNYRAGSFAQPYWGLDNNKFTEDTDRFFGNLYAIYTNQLAEKHKLNIKYQLGVDTYTTHYQDIWGYGNKGSNNDGQITNRSWTRLSLNSLLTAIYDWDISDDYKLNVLLGNEILQNNRKYNYSFGQQFQFPGWNHIDNTTSKDNSERKYKERTVGFFANVSLSYKNMLYLNLTGRNDFVSDMPTKEHSFFYPSASLGFILTELKGLKDNKIINFAKIRASVAQVGQAGQYLPNHYVVPLYGGGFYNFSPILYPIDGQVAYIPSRTVVSGELKPEKTNSYEFGFDVNFFNNMFILNYTYSRQNSSNQIFEIPLAGSTGLNKILANGGKMHSNTHEITLSVNPIRTKVVDWVFGFNWTKITNYVDELAPGVPSIFIGGFTVPQVRAAIGDQYPVIYGSSFLRNENGALIIDEKGLPMSGADDIIGKVSPDFILGFNTSVLLFKKLNISAVFEWKCGGQMYGGTNGLLDMYGVSKETESREVREYIVPGVKQDKVTPNDVVIKGANAWQAYYSRMNSIQESSIYDNSFIKLREITLGYQLLNTNSIGLSVNAFMRNLLIWTNYPNLDPESSQGNTNMAGAFERFSLPQTTSFGMGVNVKF